MEIQSTPIRVPKESKLYIFGSALSSCCPNDLDVLVVYDPLVCPPKDAYLFHEKTKLGLEANFDLPVHITLLTPSEESGTDFIKRTGAVEIAIAIRLLARHSKETARKASKSR